MKLIALSLSFAMGGLAVGCSDSDGAISLDGTGSTLTDKGDDFLFTVKVDQARTDGYALPGLAVKIKPKNGEPVTVTCTPKDANANLHLDQGEGLSCTEGAANLFDAKSIGKEATVQLFAKVDDKQELVGEATWTPK